MKIIALPDIHANLDALKTISQQIRQVDLVICVGDISRDGGPEDAEAVISFLRTCNPSILAVPGNWDGPEVLHLLDDLNINLDQRITTVGDIDIMGLGASLPLPPGLCSPNEISESDFKIRLKTLKPQIGARPFIFVCHQPPDQTQNDTTSKGLHVGSKAVRAFIADTQPLVCFTGHIHEGQGIDRIGNSLILNPGPIWQGCYALVEVVDQQLMKAELLDVS